MRENGIVQGMIEYVPRALDDVLERLLGEVPAILLVGPRAAGKTTTATRLAATVVRLDRPAEAEAFRADPDAALRGAEEPLILDEWQAVPAVLGAVKRSVDQDPRPGRYVLTGSVRADLQSETWPGTGRLIRLPMFGMTVREQLRMLGTAPFIERAARQDLPVAVDPPDLRGYVELALTSGFPEAALRLGGEARQRWLESYVGQLLTRDAIAVDGGRDPVRLRRYLEAYALNSAGIVEETTLLEASALNRKTALAYQRLLENLYVAERVPAWTSNRLKRLTLSPKRYVVDPAIAAAILGIDATAIMRDGDMLGRVVETFARAQIRAELPLTSPQPRSHHLRTEQGRQEIDLVVELGGGKLVAIEVKADAAPDRSSAKHLSWLRDLVGDRFVAGIVLHTGPRTFVLDDRITAAPICTLWA